jgi:hypothetical protein
MSKLKDLTGQKFGELTVIQRAENDKKGRTQWLCQCDCGKQKIIRGSSLTFGNTKSCGCLSIEKLKKMSSTHKMAKTRLYKIWANIKTRCLNPKYPRFCDYGGRGITICNEWIESFENFSKWALNNGYADSLAIDRINNNGNYEPSNCRWVSNKINSLNKRNNLIFEYQNKKQCLKMWAEELNIDYVLLYNRIVRRKWTFEKAISTPIMTNRRNRNAKYR